MGGRSSDVRVVSVAPAAAETWGGAHAPRIEPARVLQVALLLLVVANLGRIPFLDLGDRQAPILINDLCVGAVLGSGALAAMRRRSLWLDRVTLMALLFAGIGAVSALVAIPRFGLTALEATASLAYLARWLYYLGIYVVVINFVRADNVRGVWSALEGAMMLFAAFGIVQAIFLPNFAQRVYPELANTFDWQGHRLMSTVLEPNVAAAMILTVLLVQVAQLASGAKVAMWKPTIMLAALVMTLSRSGALAFVIGLLCILAARGVSRRLLRLGGVAVVGLIAALPKLIEIGAQYSRFGVSDASAASRVLAWQRALAVWWEYPWFGIGFNTYGFVMEQRGFERTGGASYSVEGGLLFIAVMTGVVGLAVYCAMLWLELRKCRAGWRDRAATSEDRGLFIGAAAATVAVCVHSVFVNSLLVPYVMEPLWVLWGLVYVSRQRMHALGRDA